MAAMESIRDLLTALPATRPSTASAVRAYDTSIQQHLANLNTNDPKLRTAILNNAATLLESIDPSTHTTGLLAVIYVLLKSPNVPTPVSHAVLLDKIVDFILHFDPVQVRYFGEPMLFVLELIGCGKLLPPAVAVELLSTAILRIDPSGSLFTSTHLLLAKLAYTTNTFQAALKVLDRDILFYPNMGNSKEYRALCEPNITPASYISTQTGLTDAIKPHTVLEYHHICGLGYMSMGSWSKALAAFEKVVSHPCKDKNISKIMIASYKRWILVGLLSQGTMPSAPAYTSASAQMTYNTVCRSYMNVAEAFSTANAEKLKTLIENETSLWEEDGTSSLLAEILSTYQKWRIIGLRRVYERVAMSQVREMTLNAQTGKPLDTDEEILALVVQMIESGMLDGQIEQDSDEKYLSFRDNSQTLSEADFAAQIAQSHYTIDLLGKQYRMMDERLSGNKEYVKHVIREQKRAEKDYTDAGLGFDSVIEDEDLMAGIVPHG